MFKGFQVATQKLKKNLNMNLNMAIIHIYRTFKFSSSSKLQMSFCLKRKLRSSKFSTTFMLKVFHMSIGNFESNPTQTHSPSLSLYSLCSLSFLLVCSFASSMAEQGCLHHLRPPTTAPRHPCPDSRVPTVARRQSDAAELPHARR